MEMNTTIDTVKELEIYERYIVVVNFASTHNICGILLSEQRNIRTMDDIGSVLSFLDLTFDLTNGDTQVYNSTCLCIVPMIEGYLHPEVSRYIIKSDSNSKAHYISKITLNSGKILEFVQASRELITYFQT